MAIAKKPVSNTLASAISHSEKAAEAFIAGAGKVSPEGEKVKKPKRPYMMRFEDEMLARIDKARKGSGNSIAAWIRNACNRALDEEGV